MTLRNHARLAGFSLLLAAGVGGAAAEDFTNAIQAFLQRRGEREKSEGAIVVGLLDERGSSVMGYGKLDNGTDGEVNGDTVFSIYSSSCTFTGLLLQDLVERGEMRLDDPVTDYLPRTVKMPARNGKAITLRHLLTETSGFPYLTENLEHFEPKRADNAFADFTLKDLYNFVSGYQLTCEPGLVHQHGSVDMGLLGQAMALKSGINYETLLATRICGPLKMDSTRGALTPEMKSRFAFAHPTPFGYAVPPEDLGLFTPLCGLSSTANDLLKYLSANLGFTPSGLPPLMEKLLPNFPAKLKEERELGLVESGGGNRFVGPSIIFDQARKRGVVVLCSSGNGLYNARSIGRFLLASEWNSDRRPSATNISSQIYHLYEGQYRRSPDFALGMFCARQYLLQAPKTAVYIPAGLVLAILWILLWQAGSTSKRWMLLGSALVAGGAVAALTPVVWSRVFCARYQPCLGIRSEGGRFLLQTAATGLWPIGDWDHAAPGMHPMDELLPPLPLELLPQSETRFFERLSGLPVTFCRDAHARVTGLVVHDQGKEFPYERISDQPPAFPKPLKRPVAIRLDTKLLDACAGSYEQAPCPLFPEGARVAIRRNGDQLVWRSSGRNAPKGDIEIFPESETNFFNKLGGAITFIRNDGGDVGWVTFREEDCPDLQAKKIKD